MNKHQGKRIGFIEKVAIYAVLLLFVTVSAFPVFAAKIVVKEKWSQRRLPWW